MLLTLQPGRSLGDAQVRAIRHLVASSVPGMAVEQVSVIDQSGTLLSSGEGSENALLDLQRQLESRYREALIGLLAPVLGRDNFSVEVNAEIDASESQATRESFPEESRALMQSAMAASKIRMTRMLVGIKIAPIIACNRYNSVPVDREQMLLPAKFDYCQLRSGAYRQDLNDLDRSGLGGAAGGPELEPLHQPQRSKRKAADQRQQQHHAQQIF